MNSSRWLNESSLLAIRGAARPPSARLPTTRNYTILRPTNRLNPRGNQQWSPEILRSKRITPTSPYRQFTRKFWANSSKSSANPTPHLGSPEPAPSLSQRLKKLSREYGWSALGVYFALSALDFPFCFLGVRLLGTDRIARWEHAVLGALWNVIAVAFPDFVKERQERQAAAAAQAPRIDGETEVEIATAREGAVGWSGEMAQAEAENAGSNASMLNSTVSNSK